MFVLWAIGTAISLVSLFFWHIYGEKDYDFHLDSAAAMGACACFVVFPVINLFSGFWAFSYVWKYQGKNR